MAQSTPKWSQYRPALECEPGLRDIYVFSTNEADWKTLLASVADLGDEVRFYRRGYSMSLPQSFAEASDPEANTFLKIKRDGCLIHCHFYIENEIEFDIDTKEIKSETEFKSIVDFMHKIALILNRDVIMTEENSPNTVILRVRP